MEPNRRLRRSRSNRMIAGVCGGIAEYLGADPNFVRIAAIIMPGVGWVTYLICAVIMPEE